MIELIKIYTWCKGYIHRDIKPDNLVMDYDNKSQIILYWFWVSQKKYIKKKNWWTCLQERW
jgi:serine/threonine protein kinase